MMDRRRMPSVPIEMVATDVDGTLLNRNRKLTRRVVDAVQRARQNGILVVLATARPPRALKYVYSTLKLRTAVVCYNGCLVYDPPTQTVLLHQAIGPEVARKIIEAGRRVAPRMVVQAERLNRSYTDRRDASYDTETGRLFGVDVIAPVADWLDKPMTKLNLMGEASSLDDAQAAINEAIETNDWRKDAKTFRADPNLLLVLHPRCSKAVGLAKLCKHYGIDKQAVLAIGDAPNDYGMIRWSGFGVAPGNAHRAIVDLADVTVASCDDHAVADALERYVLPVDPDGGSSVDAHVANVPMAKVAGVVE